MTEPFFPLKRKPLMNTVIYIADPTDEDGFMPDEWMDSRTDNERLDSNLIYSTKEEAKMASKYMQTFVKENRYLFNFVDAESAVCGDFWVSEPLTKELYMGIKYTQHNPGLKFLADLGFLYKDKTSAVRATELMLKGLRDKIEGFIENEKTSISQFLINHPDLDVRILPRRIGRLLIIAPYFDNVN
ncbi:hypothetical protein [Snodgrassella communis]|uniref:hypothetical protein n=1 Tax=Snodgrassella communis TaxID=2946699 RepID=UPI000C1F2938|nr:hypothetical protein [Snodgrassella communis]PIT07977.1 hypothetical protein BGI31_08300 [Snodgrassella communis]